MKKEKSPLPFISGLALGKAGRKPPRQKFKPPKLMEGVVPEGIIPASKPQGIFPSE